MKWYEWNSIEDFEAWHQPLCAELGYPISSVNQFTGEIDENAQPTVAYTSVIKFENKFVGLVEDKYAAGLTLSNYTPRLPEIITNQSDTTQQDNA